MADKLLISSFNSGELSPLLDGRVDKEFYLTGATVSDNMIPLVQGPAMQRSGTGYVKEVKTSANRTALIPFEFNVEQAYALEFGDQYMRVHKDHAVVTNASQSITGITQANPAVLTYSGADNFTNGMKVIVTGALGMIEVNNREFTVANVDTGANTFELSGVDSSAYGTYSSAGDVAEIYEIATPYAQADLFNADGSLRIQFAQTGDVMYLAHPLYEPRKLTRTGHNAWTISIVDFENGPFGPLNGDTAVRVLATATGTQHKPGDSVSIQANQNIFTANHVGSIFFMEEIYLDRTETKGTDLTPWAAAENVGQTVGTQVSYEGNVYSLLEAGGTSPNVAGKVPPTHTEGDSFDNPTGTNTLGWKRWRYLHSRWCIVSLDTFNDAKNMDGTIVTRLPAGLDSYSQTITNAVDNGSGLIRISVATHGYADGDYVTISGVTGTTEANGDWKIIYVGAGTFDLADSVFTNTYSAGGTVKRFSTWKWAHGAFSDERGYPGVVSFHEERLVFAQTAEEPDSYWLSQSASYEDFGQRSANQILATNSFRGTLASGQVNKIEWAISMTDGLVLGTASTEYLLSPASNQEALGPENFRTTPISGHGCRSVQPVRAGKTAFFVQRQGKKLRDLGYEGGEQSQVLGTDMTVRAEHLTKGYPIISMAWVKEPDALLWSARQDGKLLSFTYQAEQNVFAWGRHTLGGYSDAGDTLEPIIESVASISAPDGLRNELWLIVNRYVDGGTKRFIEYMRPRWAPGGDVEDATMSDSGLTYDGAATATISGLWHLKGETVSILADGKIHAQKTVDASGSVSLDYTASVVQVGLPVTARYQTVNLEHATRAGTAQGKKKIIPEVAVRVVESANFEYGADFTDMIRHEFTTVETLLDTYIPLTSGDQIVNWPGQWSYTVRLAFRNDLPIPFGIAALIPEAKVIG